MFYADAMGFLSPPGQPPVADPNLKLDLVHLTSAPPLVRSVSEVMRYHDKFIRAIAKQDRFYAIRSGEDLRGITGVGGGKTGVIYGLQCMPDDITPETLHVLHGAGVRVVALAYSGPNRYGSGFLDPYGPLTDDGKKFIKMIAETGMILDLSHAGHQTAWDALCYIDNKLGMAGTLPVMASHGGCYGTIGYYNPRNLPDEVLRKIVWMRGVVGIYTLTFGLHPSDNGLNPFISHLHHAIRVCGAENIVLGTDGVYQTQGIEEWQKHHQWMMNNVPNAKEMRARWPDQPSILNCPERMEVIESILVGHFVRDEIKGIMGENLLEFFKRSL